jgi:hypothetical protein
MKKSDLNLSPEQLTVYTALQRIRMGWLTLVVILILFAIGFFAFLYAIFTVPEQGVQKGIVGGIDVLLVWSLRAIVSHLFPPPKK